MNYNKFLFAMLIKDMIASDLEYDMLYDIAIREYKYFEDSDFNDENISEYDCIVAYIKANKESLIKMF